MMNFVLFLRAMLRHATVLVTSSFLAAVVTEYEHVRGSSTTARAFLALTGMFLVAAAYRTWLEERQKVIALGADLAALRIELAAEQAKKPAEEAQARLLDAQREEIEVRRQAREVEEEHQKRMTFLTAPDSGIRLLVRHELAGKQSNRVFLAEEIASTLAVSQSEVEEALRILRSQGYANETSFHGRWLIQP
jgi:hypothetical protein